MADSNDGGDKTEKPTDKRLKDARKKGDVPKRQGDHEHPDAARVAGARRPRDPARGAARGRTRRPRDRGRRAAVFVFRRRRWGGSRSRPCCGRPACCSCRSSSSGLLVGVPAGRAGVRDGKLKPKAEHLNPAAGVKRMFSMDNLVEVLKAVAKTALLFEIGWLVLRSLMPQFALLSTAAPGAIGDAIWALSLRLLAWTLGVCTRERARHRLAAPQLHEEEPHEPARHPAGDEGVEGDPHIKAHRRQTHQEWSQRNATNAAAQANVAAREPDLRRRRDRLRPARPAPCPRSRPRARTTRHGRCAKPPRRRACPSCATSRSPATCSARGEEGEVIPRDTFDVMAEVILWAREVREQVEAHDRPAKTRAARPGASTAQAAGRRPPRYPEGVRPDAPRVHPSQGRRQIDGAARGP